MSKMGIKDKLPLLRSVSVDFSLNLLATLVSTGTMQLVLYPRLATVLGSVDYGTMLTMIGVINVITLAFGNNLASTRLIREINYQHLRIQGDFQILLLLSSGVSAVLALVTCFVFGVSGADYFALVVLTVTTVIKSYYIVAYRLELDYRKNLYANLALCVGYAIGAWLLLGTLPWGWSFTAANILCIAFIASTSSIMREPWGSTSLMPSTSKAYASLVGGGLLSNLTTYLDRFIVYPILGPASVSIYSVATYFSKGLTLVFAPLTSVLLTYFTQGKIFITKKLYVAINGAICIGSILFVVLCVTIGSFITSLLYPTLFDSAEPYILLATIGTAINIASSFNGTVVLALASPIWQSVIPAISVIVYFCACLVFAVKFGLFGVCWAAIFSNAIRFFMNVCIGWTALSKRAKSGEISR